MVLAMGGIMTMVLVQSTQAEAWHRTSRHSYKNHRYDHHGYYKHHNRHHSNLFGNIVFPFSKGFIKISVGGERYHYHDGVFYHKERHHYRAIPAPVGARITHLPHGFRSFYVDGVPYYTYNDVYYQHTPKGYEVINKPYSKRAKRAKVANKHGNSELEDSITLSIRNREGGYFSITVKPSGDGYIGPQGEYYDEFPKMEHLKMIYGS